MKRKILSLILVFAMTVSLLTVGTGAVEPTYGDTAGHWAESSIERWSAYGIIQGSNGQFDPNGQLTCAQLATILAKLLKLPAAKDAGFTDNTADAWYYDAINRCAAAGILNGNGDGTVTPEAPISRERAMVMLGRALGIEPIREPDLTKYTDAAKVAPYAQGMVAAMIEAGIVGGVTADELAPQDNINRASTVTILDRAISTYADKAGATVNVTDGKGITLIVADNVTVKGSVETLVVASSDASVKLDGVTAEKVAVTGEGNKVELANSKVETVVASGEKAAVQTSGKTTVETVSIAAADASMSVGKGSAVATLTVAETAANAEVKVASGASVQALETAAEKTTVDNSGVIATATIAESAKGTEVKANSGSYTGTVKTEAADTTVGGTGAVAKVEASGSAASGEGAANVTTQGTTTEKTDASGATSTDTNTGKLPATDSANSEAAKDAAAGTGNDTPTTTPSTPSGGGSVHSHSYDATTHKCSCGAFDPAVVATIGNEYGYLTLQDALDAGGEVTLVKDIVTPTTTYTVTKDVTLNLNGKTLSGSGYDGTLYVNAACTLTINGDGNVIGNDDREYGMAVWGAADGAKIVINGGNFSNTLTHEDDQMDMIYMSNGADAIINGGTFKCITPKWTLNIKDANYSDGSSTIVVNGGSFYQYDPSNANNENPKANFVATGYGVTQEGNYYTVSCLFAGGTGTEKDPFVIETAEQLAAIRKVSQVYFELANDIVAPAAVEYTDPWGNPESASVTKMYSNVLDGKDYTITCPKDSYLFGDVRNSTIKNVETVLDGTTMTYFALDSTFEDVTTSGKATLGNNSAAFLCYPYDSLTMRNCVNEADLRAGGAWANYNAVFAGYGNLSNGDTYTFENCVNKGSLIGGTSSMFIGNISYGLPKIVITDCRNEGTIQATYVGNDYIFNMFSSVNADGQDSLANYTFNGESKTYQEMRAMPFEVLGGTWVHGPYDSSLALALASDGTLVVTPSTNENVATYAVTVGVYGRIVKGGTKLQLITVEVDKDELENLVMKKLAFVDDTWLADHTDAVTTEHEKTGEHGTAYTTVELDGTTYYLYECDNEQFTLNGTPKMATEFAVSAYDASGELIASAGLTQ